MKRSLAIFLFALPGAAHGLLSTNTNLAPAAPQLAPKPALTSSPGNAAKPSTNAAPARPAAPRPVAAPVVIFHGGGGFNGFVGNAPSPAAPSSATEHGTTLRWKNGESLGGEIATASSTELSWKTPLFEDPLQLRWSAVDRIDYSPGNVSPAGPFGIALRDGSFIYGDLVSITADSIVIHSARHGDATLMRSEVLSVRRLKRDKGSLVFGGPTGSVGWEPIASQQDGGVQRGGMFGPETTPALTTGPGGALLIRSWNRGGLLEIPLPDLVDVEFDVRSTKRPEFTLALGATFRSTLRIETWDDEMVLAMGDEFKAIRKIDDKERNVGLRVCWDKKTQKCSVYTPSGDLITDWTVPGSVDSTAPGLLVQNKGLDLALDLLRIRAWDGKPPATFDPKQPRVELADGRSIAGTISGGAPGFLAVQASGQATPARVALADVDALVFSPDQPQSASHEATLAYNDGTIILGSIASINHDRAAITTSFTREPLPSQLDQLRQILITAPAAGTSAEKPLAELDKIVIQGTALHGTLESGGDGWPRWTPVGGTRPSRPSASVASEITRTFPATSTLPGEPALFYLSSGDVLPGSLRSLDRDGAEFESDIMPSRKLPATELNAIQFGAPPQINVQGFADPGWHIVKGDDKSVQKKDDELEMESGTSISYPSLMQSSEIKFKYSSNGFSAARLRLFCASSENAHAMNLLIGSTGNQFISGLESTEGQFDNQVQIKIRPGDPIAVRLEIEDKQVELFVNDISTQRFPIDPKKCSGSGFLIEPASLWGNGIFPVSISGFSATSVPGRTWVPEVDGDIKAQVLTVPRFQKDDPPHHLLLAANGDVLRGEIEAATDTHFGFRCGMETLNVPRERVKAVIWLKAPEKDAPAAPASIPAPTPLDQKIDRRAMFRGVGLNSLIGFLKSINPDLKFKLPEKEDPRRVQMQFSTQTLGEALGIICSMYDLHYRVDPDGTIILEGASETAGSDLVRKTYWLKPDAVPKDAIVKDLLVAKGITFPAGTSAEWQTEGAVLSMTNTPENQDKLAALIPSDFGGSLGSPTHWLTLTSGARFGLAVDKFDHDFIIGHHPIYGAIKVPMAQVYGIRTSAPEPTTTSRSLENWRLVNAPEPVIPEPGGESSPLLGKLASAFKLPLLDGGSFDLDAQKGNIVVLDFWATWCGPCVKSLPALVETLAAFPADRVKLVGVNQGEAPAQIKQFLATRSLKFPVAMDADQGVGRKYGVDAIPRTIIVGPDGKVAWEQTGYDPDGETAASDAIKKLLAAPTAPPATTSTP